jgi:hypothetical protein
MFDFSAMQSTLHPWLVSNLDLPLLVEDHEAQCLLAQLWLLSDFL